MTPNEFEKLKEIIRAAGTLAVHYSESIVREEKTGPGDLVTAADRALESYLKSEIGTLFPGDAFWGEETGTTNQHAERLWIIDPIDGTADYANKIPTWCVSVALYERYEPQVCLVYAPQLNNFYYMIGGRAYLNDRLLRPPQPRPFSTGYFYAINAGAPIYYYLNLELRFCNAPTALSPCLAADGCVVGAYSHPAHIWDVAASVPIARAAGAAVEYLSGRAFNMRELFETGKMPEGILIGDPTFIEYARSRIIPRNT